MSSFYRGSRNQLGFESCIELGRGMGRNGNAVLGCRTGINLVLKEESIKLIMFSGQNLNFFFLAGVENLLEGEEKERGKQVFVL